MIKIGAHVSIAGGIENAPKNAAKIGCECFQIFSRSPHGGKTKDIEQTQAALFKESCAQNGFTTGSDYVIHTPYYINLASENNRIYHGSISAIRHELEVANLIEAPYVITHIGSAKDIDGDNKKEVANEKVIKGLEKIHEGYNGKAMLLLEIAAGSGEIIGDTLQEIGYFIEQCGKNGIVLGFCFDTCHAFASGYDLSNKVGVEKTISEINNCIGKEKLKVVHFNESMTGLGSKVDRHAHLDEGKIGKMGVELFFKSIEALEPLIIAETKPDKVKNDLQILKNLRTHE